MAKYWVFRTLLDEHIFLHALFASVEYRHARSYTNIQNIWYEHDLVWWVVNEFIKFGLNVLVNEFIRFELNILFTHKLFRSWYLAFQVINFVIFYSSTITRIYIAHSVVNLDENWELRFFVRKMIVLPLQFFDPWYFVRGWSPYFIDQKH